MKKYFFKKISKSDRGFTLIETLFYLASLVILLGIVITLIISLARTYRTIQATKNLESSAVFALERLTREIRNASDVNTAQSAFSTSTGGILSLATTNATGTAMTQKFYLSSDHVLRLDTNGTYVGPLTLSGVEVTQLQFKLATTTNSKAIKVNLGLRSVVGNASTSKTFYSTVVLRGGY